MYVVRSIRAGVRGATHLRSAQFSSSAASGGSSFFQRLTSFFAGMGVAAGGCGLLVHTELSESNIRFDKALRSLEQRIEAIESK